MPISDILTFIVPILLSVIAGALIENKLKVMSFLKKAKAFLLNSQANLKIAFLYSTQKTLPEIQTKFYEIAKDWKISYKEHAKTVFTNGTTNLSLVLNHDSTILIETSNMSLPIRGIGDGFNSQCDMIDGLARQLDFKLIKVSFTAKLPYYQEIAQFSIPRHFEIKDYSIDLKDKKLNVELKLVLDNISATNNSISELKSVFGRVLSF